MTIVSMTPVFSSGKEAEGLSVWPSDLVVLKLAADLIQGVRMARRLHGQRDLVDLQPVYIRSSQEFHRQSLQRVAWAEEQKLDASELFETARELYQVDIEAETISADLLDRAHHIAKATLVRDLSEVPKTKEEHSKRVRQLAEISWIGVHAWETARGWVPLLERAVVLAESYSGEEDRSEWSTHQIKEKFGTLRWYVWGSEFLQELAEITETTSDFCCIVCGRDAQPHAAGWVLNLCPEHTEFRLSGGSFSKLIYAT